MKRIVFVLLLAFMLILAVSAEPIYKYENTVDISDSVSLTNVYEFYADRNISYSYIKADISDEDVGIELLKSEKGVDVLERVEDLALTEENTVAAVNGDFFSWYKADTGFSLGIEYKDGELLGSPINPSTMATVAYRNGEILMRYLDFHIMVVAPNWEYKEIRHLNKHTEYYGDILMYTNEFNNGLSPAPGGEVLEVVVEDGVIAEFRRNMPPCEIPENGCVLVVSEGSTMFFANNFKVGDKVKFDYYITPDIREYETAFGAGAFLVYKGMDMGKMGDYSHEVAGLHPRTAMGVDEEGKTLYIVTVDGRQSKSQGMRMSTLAELMISLGCYTAVNLDGGGSTRMIASTLYDSELHTVNSPTEDRRVINAIAVTVEGEEEPKAAGIEIKPLKDYVFVGQKALFDKAVFDENKRPLNVDDSEIIWSSDKGFIENGEFHSDVGGRITVTAEYMDFKASAYIDIIDNVSGIDVTSSVKLSVGEEYIPEISVFDAVGRYIENVENKSVFELTSSNPDVVSVTDGKITALKDGTAVVTVSKNGVESHIGIAVGSFDYNYFNSFESESIAPLTYPKDVKGNASIYGGISKTGNSSVRIAYDFTDDTEIINTQSTEAQDTDEEIAEPESVNTASAENEDAEAEVDVDADVEAEAEAEAVSTQSEIAEDYARAVYSVLDTPVSVSDNCKKISVGMYIKQEFKHSLRAQFSDADGKIAIAEFDTSGIKTWKWNEVTAEIPDDLKRPLTLTRVYVLYMPGEERDKGEVYIDDLSLVSTKEHTVSNTRENVYITSNMNTNVSYIVRIGALSDKEKASPVSAYLDGGVKRYVSSYGTGAYIGTGGKSSVGSDGKSVFIRLDTSKGGLRKTDSKQWTTLSDTLKSTDKENVIIMSDNSIFGSDEFENRVLCDLLSDCGKNVIVVTASDSASYKNIKGVHYFTLDNDHGNADMGLDTDTLSVLELKFGDGLTFDFVKM